MNNLPAALFLRTAVLATALLASGCAGDIKQRVDGQVAVEGAPIASTEVRITSGKDSKSCLDNFLTAQVRAGAFSLEREVPSDTQTDSLCIKDEGVWMTAWHNAYGPVPSHLTFTCNKTGGHWACKANELESVPAPQ